MTNGKNDLIKIIYIITAFAILIGGWGYAGYGFYSYFSKPNLLITSEPTGASIYEKGSDRELGKTPYETKKFLPLTYEYILKLDGYRDEIVSITVSTELQKVNIQLKDNKELILSIGFVKTGNEFFDKQDYENAILEYSKAIEASPTYDEAYYGRGLAYYYIGDYDNSIADNGKAVEINPKYVGAYSNLGLGYYLKNDFDQAILQYTTAIQLDDTHLLSYYNRGFAYIGKKDTENAISDFTKAIELKPDYIDAYYKRGILYSEKNELNSSIQDLSKVIELDANYYDAYYQRGLVYKNNQEFESAILDFDKAIESNPKNVDAYFYRASTNSHLSKSENAIEDYKMVIKLDPKYSTAYNNLAWIYFEQNKNLDKALKFSLKSVELDSENLNNLDTLSEIYLKLGKNNKSKEIDDKILSMSYSEENLKSLNERKAKRGE